MRRAASLQALALVGLLVWLFVAGSRNLQIVNFNLFMVLLVAAIAAVLGVFAVAGRIGRPGQK